MKIVILDSKTLGFDIDLCGFEKFGEVIKYDVTTSSQTLDRVKDCDIVITNKVILDKNIIEKSNLKLICISATGMNNVDLEAAKNNNVEVKNVAGYSTSSVAQVTISIVLKFIQKLDYYINYTKQGNWIKSDIFTNIDVPFNELDNKKWGIIGLGSIGKQVAHIAEAFGCEVSYYSTSGKNTNTKYKQKNLNDLLETSDIITIHCGLNDMTHNLLNKSNLNKIKDNSILVNVGRGGIINENDLVEAFLNKNFYLGLDVLEYEPMKENSPLSKILNNDKVIITPHIAWASYEARNRLIKSIIKNIEEFVL